MREDKTKTEEGAALWARVRHDRAEMTEVEAPDPQLLAAYLDGGLAGVEAVRLEARLARDPALLDEVLTLRASLAAGPEAAPAGLVARAQALRPQQTAPRRAVTGRPGWVERLLGDWLRPAVPAFATLALVLACAGAFELGRYQSEQLAAEQSAELGDSDVPVDLLLDGLI
ncbi:MAG: hypothetical protein RH942_10065 [Kiloniellaceae bacterium]